MEHDEDQRVIEHHQEDTCADPPLYVRSITPGDDGIRETVGLMRELIRTGQTHPVVRRHAEDAVARVAPGDLDGELAAVVRYLAARIIYRNDPAVSEYLQAPWYVLTCIDRGRRPGLDCDDATMLSLAMLGALGHETTIRTVALNPESDFDHVYGIVEREDGRRIRVDLTYAWRPQAPRGVEYRAEETPV